ncbi:alpha/beta hydrolase [Parvibaculum sp.]|uniref:alpha/beta fold hydrolase n=1 Tax=Parvibaculum sp. TaxID=2024848 RepID=UPI000C982D57|nr:alpha/beta hydrolase [Parvibaculum sp.]MAB12816.1 epoxide hydrolase [Parvibaculum sp.]
MTFPKPYFIETNGIRMAVHEAGPKGGIPVLLVHGWPEIAYSWRHQMKALADAGYRAIAPDMRGYGNTGGPLGQDAVPLYDMEHLTGDLTGLLDALGIDKAIMVGHDWGGLVAWQMPLMHPSRVMANIGVNTPFIPRLDTEPIAAMRAAYGEDMYIVFFQQFGEAEKVLGKDTHRSLRFFYRRSGVTMEEYMKLPEEMRRLTLLTALQAPEDTWTGEALLTTDEFEVYAKAFEKTGWEGGINWYRNFTRNWERSENLIQRVDVPGLMISAADDIALPPAMAEGMEKYVPDLEKHIIPDCGHWTQSEKPEELNRLMLDWLKRRFPA